MKNELQQYLLLLDLDKTLLDTFAPSPQGITVEVAYLMAVKTMFGDAGVQAFLDIDGLQNRAPGELMRALLEQDATLLQQTARLRGAVLYGNLSWGDRSSEWVLTEILVWEKMKLYLEEMRRSAEEGVPWPQAYPGVGDFFHTVDTLNRSDQFQIYAGIVSSGHKLFITTAFENLGLPVLDILVSDDEVRMCEYPFEVSERSKPGVLPFNLALLSWKKAQLIRSQAVRSVQALVNHTMYVGDDVNKDGGFASQNGMPFCHFVPMQSSCTSNGHVVFNHWEQMTHWLLHPDTVRGFEVGTPLNELLVSVNPAEV